ncbi:response regulator transcription factor [Cohnella cholangitidis]|uniref:Response regulator transcription factor n=1 Tax=Cohnella cholangitidis TaxID=2598458 RepID=A0A7G5BZE6_9BACL|nr:response regulator transcription factor [Cohnella cholangitidis]QMV42330.1 response regulator transcription factor [Cohnella cholangitidis]
MIRILIADDQTLMREGLQTILSIQDDMEVVGEAKDGEEALRLAAELKPQVVLMDIRMPRMDGLKCTRRLKRLLPDTVLIILTTFAEDEYIVEALASGATGFLLKDIPGKKLAQAIRDATQGEFLLPTAIAEKLAKRIKSVDVSAKVLVGALDTKLKGIQLSGKEYEVARALIQGRSNPEIAETLFMSIGTVKNYVSGIYAKLKTNDRTIASMMLQELIGETPYGK